MAVFVLILFDLLLRQRGKIILFKTGNKKCAADNVIRHTVIIGQGAVPRQAQQLALVIADERYRVWSISCTAGSSMGRTTRTFIFPVLIWVPPSQKKSGSDRFLCRCRKW